MTESEVGLCYLSNKEDIMDQALRRFYIRTGVLDALSRHGLEHNSPLRAQLEANAIIAVGSDSYVVMKNGNSLDAEIENWLSSQRLAGSLPAGSRTVAKGDTDSVQKHFADIAAGTVRVE
jgi:hypothetical protein